MNQLSGAEAVVRMLQRHGVTHIFGLCGDTSLPLYDALQRLDSLMLVRPAALSSQFHEARNILEVGKIIAQSALAREESRGAHYRSDFPLKDEAMPAKHSFASKDAPVFFA